MCKQADEKNIKAERTMQNGFELHNQSHTSASSINLWANAPHMWCAQYLFGKRSEFGAAAKCGVLVEDAITNVLARGFTAEYAISSALGEYNKFIALSATDSDKKRAEALPGMIELGLEALKPYGAPEFDVEPITGKLKQKKVEIVCNGDGWSLPVVGYLDYYFPAHGVVVDLKTTQRMPSEMSDSHKRQACIYQHAMGNQGVKFLYVTGKKSQMFDCGDVKETLAEIKAILNRQEAFLRLGDKELLRSIVPVNTETFYNDASITKELYGI
jgi:hypothetical protein